MRARSRTARLHTLVATGLAALLLSAAAAADERESANAAALKKFDEGRAALEAGDHAAALAAFDASNRLLASPNSLLYMARCYKALGKVASAYTTFRLAQRHAQDRLVATEDRRYIATRDAAGREAAEIEADVPKLAIVVPADAPVGLVVTQNGVVVSPSSYGAAVDTDPGHVTIDATGPRLTPFHEELDLAVAETRRVDVHAERVPTATVKVRLASRPLGLAVRIDGAPVDPGELAAPREVDPGSHVVEVTAPWHRPFRWEGGLGDGRTADVEVVLEAEPSSARARRRGTPPWMFYASAGTAVAAVGAASILAVHASARSQDEQDKSRFVRDLTERDSIRSEATVANVFFIAGAILGAGAVVLAFTTEWRKDATAPASRAGAPDSHARIGGVRLGSRGLEGTF